MTQSSSTQQAIVPRKGPDFGFDDSMPKFWLDGDPFKTRFFDAMSTLFPEGEKFFIQCVRDYREEVKDPELARQVKDFIYQEGQHSMAHGLFNDRLRKQGVQVDKIEEESRVILALFRRKLPRAITLAQTSAVEHFTAFMAHSFMKRTDLFDKADPRMRALYFWHAAEEIEHKSVAFDVLQKVAGAGYFTRILPMLWVSMMFPLHIFLVMRHMLKVDGFSFWQRTKLWARGLWWLYGWNGLVPPLLPEYFSYYRPGFHPWQDGALEPYQRWRSIYDRTGDALAAGNALSAA
jgi:predicted metal-dependent hydrolase